MVHVTDPYRAKPYTLDRTTAPAFRLVRTLWLPMATGVQTGNRLAPIDQLMPFMLFPVPFVGGTASSAAPVVIV